MVSLHVGDVDLSCEIMVSLNWRGDQRRLAVQNWALQIVIILSHCSHLTNIRTNAEFTTGKNSSLKIDQDNQNQTIQMVRTCNTLRELGNGRFYHAPGA